MCVQGGQLLPKRSHLGGAGYLDAVPPFLFQAIISHDSLIMGQKNSQEDLLQSPLLQLTLEKSICIWVVGDLYLCPTQVSV